MKEKVSLSVEEHNFMSMGNCEGHTHKFTIRITSQGVGQHIEVVRDNVPVVNAMVLNNTCPRDSKGFDLEAQGTQDRLSIEFEKESE
jgi:hypothetical protein